MRGSNVCNCFLSAGQGKVNRKLYEFTYQAKSCGHIAAYDSPLIISISITEKFVHQLESTESRQEDRSVLTGTSKIPQLTSGKWRSIPQFPLSIAGADSHAGLSGTVSLGKGVVAIWPSSLLVLIYYWFSRVKQSYFKWTNMCLYLQACSVLYRFWFIFTSMKSS